MSANWKQWLGPSVQSREQDLTRALYEEVRRESAHSPFATEEAITRFVREMVNDICAEQPGRPSVELGSAIWDTICEFLDIEGFALRLAMAEPPRELTLEQGVQLRTALTRQKEFLRDHKRLLPVWREKLVILFSGILRNFPPSIFAVEAARASPDGEVLVRTAKALDLCDQLPLVLDRTIITFFDDDIVRSKLFETTRMLLERNVKHNSGTTRSGDIGQSKLRFPADNTIAGREQLVASYLTDTPLEVFFNAELAFVIPAPTKKHVSANSLSSLLEALELVNEDKWWCANSTHGLEGALGFAIDDTEAPVICHFTTGTAHALLAGVTGSGKNNLLNVLITTLAIRYPPDELEFFMIDLKEGVEFQRFAECGLPHARVISMSNDAEFALNVLRGLDAEMEERGRLFVESGAKDITTYRTRTGQVMSRVLLVVDEAKTLYGVDDSSFALSFFEKIAAKGRAFGLHILLANQNFVGATLRSSTIANMGMRLVTKGRGERTADNVLDPRNTVLETLTQYDAVYNDGNGVSQYNHPCKVPECTDRDDEYLRRLAKRTPIGFRKPVVFYGHERPLLSSCRQLANPTPRNARDTPRMWLGLPMSLAESVVVTLRRESKQNFLVVDRDEEEATGVAAAVLTSLLVSSSRQARFCLLNLATPGSVSSEAIAAVVAAAGPRVVEVRAETFREHLEELVSIVTTRATANAYEEADIFLILHGVHRIRTLQNAQSTSAFTRVASDLTSLSDLLGAVARDGPYVGVHVIGWCDTAENVRRFLEPGKVRTEFGIVAAGKQPDDSLSRALIGTGKAATVGAHRMILADGGGATAPYVFRPYSLPASDWFEMILKPLIIDSDQ